MPHFFVSPKNIYGPRFIFDIPESRHISKVLRIKEGETIQIFDGEGTTYLAKIVNSSNPDRVEGIILEPGTIKNPVPPEFNIKLYPALYKSVNFDWMLQKVTELGVSAIQPILTERTIVSIKNEKSRSKLERWKKIILAAVKQSGRSKLPEIFTPIQFENALKNNLSNDLRIIPWEGENENHLSKALKDWRSQPNHLSNDTVHIFIGPEGGFTFNEIRQATKSKFTTVRLTQNILRAETAAIAAVSFFLLHDLN